MLLLAWSGTLLRAEVGEPGGGLPEIQNYELPTLNTQVWSLAQDDDGILYAGTNDRVLEYDGTRWASIPSPNESTVRSLAIAPGDRLYVGGVAELGYVELGDDGRKHMVSLVPQIAESERDFEDVWKTYVTGQGVFFQSKERLFLYSDGRMRSWEPRSRFHFSYVVRDRFFILDQTVGLLEMIGDELVPVPGGHRFAGGRLYCMLPHGEDAILIGTRQSLFLSGGTGVEPFPTRFDDLLSRSRLYMGAVLGDGTYALATLQAGILVMDPRGRLLQHLDSKRGLADDYVAALLVDRSQALWAGTNQGLSRIDYPSPVSFFDRRQGVQGPGICAETYRGRTYLGTGAGLFVSGPGDSGFEKLDHAGPIVQKMLVASGDLLVASTAGIHQVAGNKTTRLVDRAAFQLATSAAGAIVYYGLTDGAGWLRHTAEGWVDGGLVQGFTEHVLSIWEDSNGDLWLGTKVGGVYRIPSFRPSGPFEIRRYSTSDGLPVGKVEIEAYGKSSIFLTIRGLYSYDAIRDRFRPARPFGDNFDPDRWVGNIVEDRRGRTWITHGAIDYSIRTDDPAWTAQLEVIGPRGQRPPENRLLRRFDGQAVFGLDLGSRGDVWFGLKEGVARYRATDRASVTSRRSATRVLIRRVEAGGRNLDPTTSSRSVPELAYENNSIRFECALTDFADKDHNRFRFRLEGFEDDWSPWTTESSRSYTHLPEGSYRFLLEGRGAAGAAAAEPGFTFRVLPPWYRTTPAYLAVVLALIGVFLAGHRVLVRQLARRKAQLEAMVRQRTHELELSEQHYRELVDNAHDIIFTANAHGRITSLNEAGKVLLGAGEHLDSGVFFSSMASQQMSAFLRELLETRDPEDASPVLAEVELTRQDGETVPLETSTRFLRDGERFVRIETIARDITERRIIEGRLRQAQKLEAVGELAGGVAHDFNNKLTAILGFSELLRASQPDNALLGKYLSRIREAGDQASLLTRKLLAVGRRQMLSPRLVRLNALLARLEAELEHALGRSIDLALDLESDLPAILVDPQQIEQIVLELAANARDAMPEGGHFRIATSNTSVTRSWPEPGSPPPGELVELAVSDDGVGMNEEQRTRIFEPFFTTKEFGQGAGLGLATVYGIVHQSDGYLRVESREGAGTTFRLFFPIAEPVAESISKHARAAGSAALKAGPELALVVDDDPGVLIIAGQILEAARFRVLEASSAEAALEILERESGISLVLTDVTMPGMSGLELAARIRERDPAIKIIVMSGYTAEVLKGRGAWEHKDAFVAKPFGVDEMLEVIRRVTEPGTKT